MVGLVIKDLYRGDSGTSVWLKAGTYPVKRRIQSGGYLLIVGKQVLGVHADEVKIIEDNT